MCLLCAWPAAGMEREVCTGNWQPFELEVDGPRTLGKKASEKKASKGAGVASPRRLQHLNGIPTQVVAEWGPKRWCNRLTGRYLPLIEIVSRTRGSFHCIIRPADPGTCTTAQTRRTSVDRCKSRLRMLAPQDSQLLSKHQILNEADTLGHVGAARRRAARRRCSPNSVLRR